MSESAKAKIYQQFIHCGEEPELSPAFIVNMFGCNLHCPTCSERIHWETAKRVWCGDAESYAKALAPKLDDAEVRSFEWIGGEPTIHLDFVIEATIRLKELMRKSLPFYLNTNGYYNTEYNNIIIQNLDGFVFDLKSCAACSSKIVGSGAPDYYDRVCENIRIASASDRHVIVRHLVMPGHVECCTKPCLEWLRKNAPTARINVMTTFQNFNDCPEYPFCLSDEDLRKVKDM